MVNKNGIPLLAIVGPTASGKTKLSIDLAKKYNGEIISADSMQIYKYMTIGTAKPTYDEMCGVPHHMIDILNPDESFSVAEYVANAKKIISDINARGKLPILVGGTGLYVNSLIENIEFSNVGEDMNIRNELMEIANNQGNDKLYEILQKIDPEICNEIHQNNLPRVIRAIEVFKLTNHNMTWHKNNSKTKPSDYNYLLVGLTCEDRQKLYDKINKRVGAMVESGLLDEAKNLFSSIYCGTAKQAIGYKELQPYFDKTDALENCLDKIRLESRHYAKRQLTWFRKNTEINWIKTDLYNSYGEILNNVCEMLEKSKLI